MANLELDLGRTLRAAKLPDSLAGDILRGQLARLPAEPTLALVLLDAHGIQSSLTESPRPVTMAGASLRLSKWDADVRGGTLATPDDGPPDLMSITTVIYAGGGNAVLLTPAEHARRLCDALESQIKQRVGIDGTAAALLVSPRDLVAGRQPIHGKPEDLARLGLDGARGFAGCLDALRLVVARKNGEDFIKRRTDPLIGPRCVECNIRHRTHRRREADRDPSLCRLCHDRRVASGIDKGERGEARTFQEFLSVHSLMAYVCIDGIGVGAKLAAKERLLEYHALSNRLLRAFARPDPDSQDPQRPRFAPGRFQVLSSGGDDLWFVVPLACPPEAGQDDAFALICQQIRFIERHLDADQIGVGVGVVIAGTQPADFCVDRAKQLCTGAKRHLTRLQRHGSAEQRQARSAVDFEVLLEGHPFADEMDSMREDEALTALTPLAADMKRVLRTQRPYLVDDFEQQLRRARLLQEVERSQLAILLDAFAPKGDAASAYLALLYQLARDTKRLLSSALAIAPGAIRRMTDLPPHLLRPRPGAPPKQQRRDYDTGLCDLIEISDLLNRPVLRDGEEER